jgi:hypothetical protein
MSRITSSNAAMQISGVAPANGFRPGLLARSIPCVGVSAVHAMAVVRAFHDRALLDQRAEGPALQRAIRGAGDLQGQLALKS